MNLRAKSAFLGCLAGLLVMVILVVGLKATTQDSHSSEPKISDGQSIVVGVPFDDQIIELTNKYRKEKGLDPLVESSALNNAAQGKADDMLERDYFAHTAPDGTKPWYWFKKVNYDYIYAGENLGECYGSAEELVDSWIKSPGHRANILSPFYEEIGIGITERPRCLMVVQLFGTPELD